MIGSKTDDYSAKGCKMHAVSKQLQTYLNKLSVEPNLPLKSSHISGIGGKDQLPTCRQQDRRIHEGLKKNVEKMN